RLAGLRVKPEDDEGWSGRRSGLAELVGAGALGEPGTVAGGGNASGDRGEAEVPGGRFQGDAQHELGAAARPATPGLDILQPFFKAADVDDKIGAIRRKGTIETGQLPAGVDGHIADIVGMAATATHARPVMHGGARAQPASFEQGLHAMGRLEMMRVEIGRLTSPAPSQESQGGVFLVTHGHGAPRLPGEGPSRTSE